MKKTSKHILYIEKREICFLQWILESYNGIASMRTRNPENGEIEISIAPGCEQEVRSLMRHLTQEGSIHVKQEKSYG